MMYSYLKVVLFIFDSAKLVSSEFVECHTDSYKPSTGLVNPLFFTWLGVLQYVNVKTGSPHYFRVPRVILVSRQYVLTTAVDAAEVPEGFALGNVIFGEYERDEDECKITIDNVRDADCRPTILMMPISDVLVHPEYRHFKAKHSVAVLKLLSPIRSNYMVPVCLPFDNALVNARGKNSKITLKHVDFSSDTPRDFLDEDKHIFEVKLLPRELCFVFDDNETITYQARSRIVCTSDCGLRSGAPTLFHEHTGHWTIVAMSMGMSPCPDPLRASERPRPPARHVNIHPYVPWITAAISGKAIGGYAKDDPFGIQIVPRAYRTDLEGRGWVGHWWLGGRRCYDRGRASKDVYCFYHEVLRVDPDSLIRFTYYMEINAEEKETWVVCVKVRMPYQIGQPLMWGENEPIIKLLLPVLPIKSKYDILIEAFGFNKTEDEIIRAILKEEDRKKKHG